MSEFVATVGVVLGAVLFRCSVPVEGRKKLGVRKNNVEKLIWVPNGDLR